MGTRALVGLVTEERTVFLYNHSDGYPTWLGRRVVTMIRVSPDLTELATKLDACELVDEQDNLTKEGRERLRAHEIDLPDDSRPVDWYAALRDIQCEVPILAEVGYLPMYTDTMPVDDIHIEWVYVLDFTKGELRTYGPDQKHLATHPFTELPTAEELEHLETTGYSA